MSTLKRLENSWIVNFKNSPLVNEGVFDKKLAVKLFNSTDPFADFKCGIAVLTKQNYRKSVVFSPKVSIEEILKYLHFIGIMVSQDKIESTIKNGKTTKKAILNKVYYIFRHLAAAGENLNINDPYFDNQGDIMFFLRMADDSDKQDQQLTIFEKTELPDLYNKYIDIPEGYPNDELLKELFSKIEKSNDSFFITGKAGTGKSTFIQYFAKQTKKKVVLTAFTGIAAINVGGVTVHSFFQLPPKPFMPEDQEVTIFHKYGKKRQLLKSIDTIVIDEVSMLRADLLQAIDYSLRMNCEKPEAPFGGKQIIFVGDIFQLPPVLDNRDPIIHELFTNIYKCEYFFGSLVFPKLNPKIVELSKVYRQENLEFIGLLDAVRLSDITGQQLQTLNNQYNPKVLFQPKEFKILLASTNHIASAENKNRLEKLHYRKHIFEAEIEGEFPDDKYPALKFLELKRDAQVMFVQNDSYSNGRRWVNGTIGIIDFISEELIEVSLSNGEKYEVEKAVWENRKYTWDKKKKKIISEVIGTYTHFPLKLAWAITIHKSQGLTFDKVVIDMGSGAFVNGQTYTALSRCRTIEGITLKHKLSYDDLIPDKRLTDFYKNEITAKSKEQHASEEISEEDKVNIQWWNDLDEIWRDLFLFNLEFSTKLENPDRYSLLSSLEENYKRIVRKPYEKPIQYNFDSIKKKLATLEMFHIDKHYSNSISNLQPLSELTNLKRLSISNNKNSLSPISNLIKIKSLFLYSNNANLRPIANLINLNSFDYSGKNTDLSALRGLINLKSIYIYCNEADLQALANLTNLESLNLSNNTADLSPISNLLNLETLRLTKNVVDLTPINNLINLKSLYLVDNEVDLSPINQLIKTVNDSGGKVYL